MAVQSCHRPMRVVTRSHVPRADWASYERVFVGELERARQAGIGEAIFGDINLLPHREWEEKVCVGAPGSRPVCRSELVPGAPSWRSSGAE
jgi:hypothetical protein